MTTDKRAIVTLHHVVKSYIMYKSNTDIMSIDDVFRYQPTGYYLRPSDMEYCVEHTGFTEDEIFTWFKSFR